MTWTILKQIKSAVNSTSTLHYSYTDLTSHQGISYYRLKQTDTDSSFKYSHSIAIENCITESTKLDVTIYPNPSKGMIQIYCNGSEEQIISINVYTVFGKQVFNTEGYLSSIDLSHLEAGIYSAQFNTKENRLTKKIVIEK